MAGLSRYIDAFKGLKVLCIGDVILDKFMYGDVSRISPEAPVPVFHYQKESRMLGGAGNVVANLAALNASPLFIGMIGDDTAGKEITGLLQHYECEAFLPFVKDYPTTVKTRFIAGHQHLLRCDMEKITPLPKIMFAQLEQVGQKMTQEADIVILSDYNKGLLSPEVCQLFISLGKQHNKTVLVDPKGLDYSKYSGADLVKPNLKEFCAAAGVSLSPDSPDFIASITSAACSFLKKFKIKAALITLSEHGMFYVKADKPKDAVYIKAKAKEVFDVSGAGDTSVSVLALAFAAGAGVADAVKLANFAAGIVVGKLGTATVSADEIKEVVAECVANDDWIVKRKIITEKQIPDLIKKLRAEGKSIGFTNGCFDLLHLGHLHSFVQLKKECDVLFVGINSDSSVKKLKGKDRPIQNEQTRMFLLASLEPIDYVIVFKDGNAVKLVEKITPDVIGKQGYTLENWPEAKTTIALGGKALFLEKLEGYSTSNLIKKMGES